LDHQTPGEFPVHPLQQRNAHHQRVGEGGDGEQSYGPFQTPPLADVAPDRQHRQHDRLLQRVRRDEPEVHLVGVVGGDEVEGEQRDCEQSDEAVYAGALVRGEDFPPFDRRVSE